MVSYKSNLSSKTRRLQHNRTAAERLNKTLEVKQADILDTIGEQLEDEDQQNDIYQRDGLQTLSEESTCNQCQQRLNEDELILNQRFIMQAQDNGLDTSPFPLCVKCHFE